MNEEEPPQWERIADFAEKLSRYIARYVEDQMEGRIRELDYQLAHLLCESYEPNFLKPKERFLGYWTFPADIHNGCRFDETSLPVYSYSTMSCMAIERVIEQRGLARLYIAHLWSLLKLGRETSPENLFVLATAPAPLRVQAMIATLEEQREDSLNDAL